MKGAEPQAETIGQVIKATCEYKSAEVDSRTLVPVCSDAIHRDCHSDGTPYLPGHDYRRNGHQAPVT